MKKLFIILIFNFSFLFVFGNNFENREDTLFKETFETQEVVKKSEKAIVVQNMKISNIDPALMDEDYSRRIIPLVYETLFKINLKGDIEKNLVDEYSWITERELYIKIKKGILFHDNSKLTAKNIKNSLEFLKENGALRDIYSEITNIKILSENELIIKIIEENQRFLNILTYGISSIVKRDNKNVFGTGKYKVKTINGKETILNRFDNYYGEKGQFEEVVFTWEIDEKQRLIDFFNGSVNLVANMKKENIEEGKLLGIISSQDLVSKSKLTVTKALIFGEQKDYPLEFRKILDKIIPKNTNSFFSQEFLKANLSRFKDKAEKDLSKKEIKEKIKKLNLEKEIKLMILNTESDMDEANKIKKNLKEYGIEVKILPHQIEAYNRKISSKDYDIAIFNMTMEKDDLVLLLTTILLNEVKNIELYNSLIPFFEMLKIENNLKNREQIMDKMAFLIQQNLPYIVLDHYKYYTVTTPEFMGLLNEIRKFNTVRGER